MGGITGRASGRNKATTAVWLGDWSCGKSWFSQQLFLRKRATSCPPNKCIHCFGLFYNSTSWEKGFQVGVKFYLSKVVSIPSKVGLLTERMHGLSAYLKKQQKPNLLKLILPTTPGMALNTRHLNFNLLLPCYSNLTVPLSPRPISKKQRDTFQYYGASEVKQSCFLSFFKG